MVKLTTCAEKLKEWIVESEMGGDLDDTDPFYPAYEQLIVILDKLYEEESY